MASLLAGCSGPTICPAIGYTYTLTVSPERPTEIGRLELVSGEGCSSLDEALPPGPSCVSRSLPREGDRWIIENLSTAPGRLDVRVYGQNGEFIETVLVVPSWKRMSGTKRCGGPQEGTAGLDLT